MAMLPTTVARATAGKLPAQARTNTRNFISNKPASLVAGLGLPVASILSAATVLLAGAPVVSAADLALGETVFNGNCAACHTGGRNSVIPQKTLDKEALEQYLDGGFNIEAIIYQVENGKGAMPAWADRLDEDEIQSVAAYVYKQASEAAWKY